MVVVMTTDTYREQLEGVVAVMDQLPDMVSLMDAVKEGQGRGQVLLQGVKSSLRPYMYSQGGFARGISCFSLTIRRRHLGRVRVRVSLIGFAARGAAGWLVRGACLHHNVEVVLGGAIS